MTLTTHIGALLVQAAAAPETTLVRDVSASHSWLVVAQEVAGAAVSIAFLVLIILLVPALVRLRGMGDKLEKLIDSIEKSVVPITQHATRIADNVEYVTTSVRADVQEVRRTLHDANDNVRNAIDSSSQRMHELGALLRLVQTELEHAFVSTASTIRGVQAGAATFRHGAPRSRDAQDVLDEQQLDAMDRMDHLDEMDVTGDEIDRHTLGDLEAARDAAEDGEDGYYDRPTYQRAEPRIKRS